MHLPPLPPARLAGLAAFLGCSLALAAPAPGFEGAQWIWFSREPMPLSTVQNFPGGACYFRAHLDLPDPTQLPSAELIITADNLFSLYLNGQLAGESQADNSAWGHPWRFDVTPLLVPGRNVLAVEAVNTLPGPAGLIAKLIAQPASGNPRILVTDGSWLSTDQETPGWEQPDFPDQGWRAVHVAGDFGIAPWGQVAPRSAPVPAGGPLTDARRQTRQAIEDLKEAARLGLTAGPRPVLERPPPPDYPWPDAVLFIGQDCSLYRPPTHTGTSYDSLTVTIFNPHHSRAFPEHDLPAPVKVGRHLLLLRPARPDTTPEVLFDAGAGALGSPTVSFDGRWIYFSMVRAGEAFFHLYRLSADGEELQRLTDGPFHDIDPVELPDGRLAFTSTRIGTFEEYHNPPSRALFVMPAAGGPIRPLTYTFIFDNEPEVLADGRLLFLRSDNFFDRGKVETLLHAVHPDGTRGLTEFGLELGPEYGSRLRAFYCGSPAPLPDGRVAFVTGSSIAVGWPGCRAEDLVHLPVEAADVAALPDGRLLATVRGRTPLDTARQQGRQPNPEYRFEQLALLNPNHPDERAVILYDSGGDPIHSPLYLGARQRPPQLVSHVDPRHADDLHATGILFCQNARFTQKTTAGWPHVRAIRVLAGKGLTVRSSHSYIVHAGSEVVELGTVPLAPDGSFAVEVPADTAIAFQAVDAEGRSELNEMSWIYVRPGESRGCVGCHQPRQVAPPSRVPTLQALRAPPLKLTGQGQPHRFRGNNAAVTGLMELQFDRYREVAGLDRHRDASHTTTGPGEIAALLAQLDHLDAPHRLTAAQRLALFRHPAAAPALAQRLRDPDREVRVAAAFALATCATRASALPLLEALDDPDPLVAQTAALALENLTGHAAPFNPFAGPATQAHDAQAWRAWLLDTGWDQIEQQLIRQLHSPNRDHVRRAAVALGRTGGPAAREALRHYVARERSHNPYPEWRVHHRGDGAMFNSLSPANPRTLQAATRALGYLQDASAVPLLADTLLAHHDPETGNLFLAEAAVEALARIATPEAETALALAFPQLPDYIHHTRWYGDHDALIACHAAPVHYFILEALDALGSPHGLALAPHLIRSLPTDTDRALFLPNDDYETLVGRVLRRGGAEAAVVEACLAQLGDPAAPPTPPELAQALATTHAAWGGTPDPENRAAQVLSLVCRDPRYAPRVRAAFDRYRTQPTDIPRVFDTGIPVVTRLPVKHWVCFYLARTLGYLADPHSVPALIAALAQSPPEAATGRPDPLGPGVLFLHNDLTPCWRAAVAWALGQFGHPEAAPVLLDIVRNLDNATDTRHAAAQALGRLAPPSMLPTLRALAQDYPEVSTRRALLEACAGTPALPLAAHQRQP